MKPNPFPLPCSHNLSHSFHPLVEDGITPRSFSLLLLLSSTQIEIICFSPSDFVRQGYAYVSYLARLALIHRLFFVLG